MKVLEAKELVLGLISRDVGHGLTGILVDPTSPDPSDEGKFVINGKIARAIQHHSGWHPVINLDWFSNSFDPPRINDSTFFWYVFAIPNFRGRYRRPHYFLCDYLQMREWVLEFAAPKGNNHRDHNDWMANIHVYKELGKETQAYFRWGDEELGFDPLTSRVISLDNIATLADRRELIGTYAKGGESEAHRRLKLFVAHNPTVIGLKATARGFVEYKFRTGDHVDVLFENHFPLRSVVEIELGGDENICTGIHQAIKYRSLAEADAGYAIQSHETKALVVAYQTKYNQAISLAKKYDVELHQIEARRVLVETL